MWTVFACEYIDEIFHSAFNTSNLEWNKWTRKCAVNLILPMYTIVYLSYIHKILPIIS